MNLFILKEFDNDWAGGVSKVAQLGGLGEDKFLDKLADFVTEAKHEHNTSSLK